MAAKDTALLGEILSTQKALLKYFQDKEKKGGDADDKKKSGTATVEKGGAGGSGTFGELVKELQSLNETSKKQLEVLERIDKNTAGGMAAGGGTTTIKSGGDMGELGANLVSLSLGILAMVGAIAALALVSGLVSAAIIGAIGVGLIILGFNKLFEYIGAEDFAQKVQSGTKNLFNMAGAIALFTLSIIVTSLAIQQVGFPTIAGTALAIMGFAGLFFLLGKGSETIEDGAKAAAYMGLGMASIGLGIVILALSLKVAGDIVTDGGGSVVAGAIAGMAILAISALAFYVMGQYANEIQKGALAAAAIGLGLAFFGVGLTMYLMGISKVMGVGGGAVSQPEGPFAMVGNMLVGMGVVATGAMALILFGTIFVLMGVLQEEGLIEFGLPIPPGTPLAGALSFALIGLALIPFAFGFDFYMSKVSKWMGTGEEGAGQQLNVQALVNGYAATTGGVMTLLLVGVIFAAAGVVSTLILQGAIALGLAGVALLSLGYGINKFMEYVPPGTEVGEELKTNLVSIRDAFLAFVGQENIGKGGVINSLKGLITGGATAGTLAAAIGTAILIGPALSSIAQGLSVFANVENAPKIIGYDEQGQPIFDTKSTVNVYDSIDNIATVLPKVIQPFIDLSNKANLEQKDSLLSIVTGINLGMSPFARGVSIAGEIGPVLSSLAQGIGAFANVQQAPKFIGYDDKGQPIYSKNEVVDLFLSIDNIKSTIEKIMDPFIDLSNEANLEQKSSLLSIMTGINLSESPFARGVSIAGQIGAVLSSLAQGIGVFGNLTQAPKITGYDDKGQPIFAKGEVVNILDGIDNISSAITAVIQPFIELANNAALGQTPSLLSIYTGIQLGESPFARGVSIVGRIGEVLSSLAVGIGNFADLKQAKKITGYDKMGQPIYSSTGVYNIVAAAKSLTNLLSTTNASSVIKPFIALGNEISQPRGLVDLYSYALIGGPVSNSPLEKGLNMGLQIGEIISAISSGIGAMANLAAVPVIKGYDKEGRAIYGTPVNALQSVGNFGKIIGDLVKEFANAAREAGPYNDLSSSEAIGPTIGGILSAVVDSIDVFSNPNKLKKITGYDDNGRPIYSKTEFVNVDSAIGNMISTVKRIIMAFGTDEINAAMDNIDIDDDENIGAYLELFIKPIEKIAEISSKLKGEGMSLVTLTDDIIYMIDELITKIGGADPESIEIMEDFASMFEDMGESLADGMNSLLEFDISNPSIFKTADNPQGSAIIGVSTNVSKGLDVIMKTFTKDYTSADFVLSENNSKALRRIIKNIEVFPRYMEEFVDADPTAFGDGAKHVYDGLFTITQVATKGEGAGKTHMKLFTDQITRLAGASTAFERFAKAFGKMAEDMGKFANNFKLMDADGIYAFKEWTGAIVELSTSNPTTFAANVVTAKNAINAGFGAGENPPVVDIADNDPSKGKEIIKKNVGSGGAPPKESPSKAPKMPTATEIGNAVGKAIAAALESTILTVKEAEKDKNKAIPKRR